MSKSFRFVMTLGAFTALAFSIPACSSDDDTKPSGNTGGTGATGGTGGTGGSSGASGSAGTAGSSGAGPVVCGGATCKDYLVGNVITVAACCSTNDKCGSDVDSLIGQAIGGAPVGCYEAEQAGDLDCACPNLDFTNPLTQQPSSFSGCCTATGKCGYAIDITSVNGPNVGCQEATWGAGMGKTCTTGTPDTSCHGDAGTDGGADSGTDSGANDASTD